MRRPVSRPHGPDPPSGAAAIVVADSASGYGAAVPPPGQPWVLAIVRPECDATAAESAGGWGGGGGAPHGEASSSSSSSADKRSVLNLHHQICLRATDAKFGQLVDAFGKHGWAVHAVDDLDRRSFADQVGGGWLAWWWCEEVDGPCGR